MGIEKNKINNAIIFRGHSIGDMMTCLPLIQAIEVHFPNSVIYCATTPIGKQILSIFMPGIKTIEFNHAWTRLQTISAIKLFSFVKQTNKIKPEMTITTTNIDDNSFYDLLSVATGAKYRLGFKNDRKCRFYNYPAKEEATEHDIQRNVGLLASVMGRKIDIPKLNIPIFDVTETIELQKILGVSDISNALVIHPFGKRLSRSWPKGNYAAVVSYLLSAFKEDIIFIGSDQDWSEVQTIVAGQTERVKNLAGKLSTREMVNLLLNAKLFIGIDSGPFHIRVLSEKPCIVIWGPGDFNKWGNYHASNVTVLKKQFVCSPCYKNACNDNSCIKRISTDEVITAIKKYFTI